MGSKVVGIGLRVESGGGFQRGAGKRDTKERRMRRGLERESGKVGFHCIPLVSTENVGGARAEKVGS